MKRRRWKKKEEKKGKRTKSDAYKQNILFIHDVRSQTLVQFDS